MADHKQKIRLTDDQLKQISCAAARGRNIFELNIDRSSTGTLSEKDLDKAEGGVIYMKYSPIDGNQSLCCGKSD